MKISSYGKIDISRLDHQRAARRIMATLSTQLLLWKQLMDNGVFDDCYPQKLNASFHYLCSDNSELTTFSLKDLIQRGPFIFSYLSIDVDRDSSFAMMEVFRTFDRSGRGNVFLEEFVVGVLDRLNNIRKNDTLLEAIAEDLLSVESRNTELATLLEKGNNSPKFAKFNANLKSLATIIRSHIRSSKTEHLSALDTFGLIRILEQSIVQAISEAQTYFHIPDSRMIGGLAEIVQNSDRIAGIVPLKIVWNTHIQSDEKPLQVVRSMGRNDSQESWMKDPNSPEQLISNLLSNVDESRLKRLRFDSQAPFGGQQGDWTHAMHDLKDLDFWGSGYIADNVQLHVLQDAFLSLSNFFQLRTSGPEDGQAQGLQSLSPVPAEKSAPGSPSKKAADKTAEVSRKIQDYKQLLQVRDGAPQPTAVPASSTALVQSNAEIDRENAVLDAVITEDLLATQETLKRTQNRLHILELIQSNIVAENYQFQEREKEKEKERAMTQLHPSSLFPRIEEDNFEMSTGSARFHRFQTGEDEGADKNYSLHFEDSATYEEILKELSMLGASLSERSSSSFALGLLLDRPIVMVEDVPKAPAGGDQQAISAIIESTETIIKEVADEFSKCLEGSSKKESLLLELQIKEEALMEYRTRLEQIDIERNEFLALNVELQILREKMQKFSKEESQARILEQRNAELSKRVAYLEDQVAYFTEVDKKYKEKLGHPSQEPQSHPQQSQSGKSPAKSSGAVSASAAAASSSSALGEKVSSEEVTKLKEANQLLAQTNSELLQQNEQLSKEIQRLKTTINLSEQRVKSILQDSMVLHQNIQLLEEENMNSKATITKLLREVEDMKNLRQYKEETERKLFEMQKEIMKNDIEMAESRENNVLINKYHSDLITAERTIEALEQKLAEYSVELEKGKIASNQLENYRETMKLKLQEIRDMSLQMHQLETQLKDVPYLNARFKEVTTELSEYKMKVDKIPGLLAEIARLRGSSRASIKSLMEQDKLISTMKHRLKLLEKDNTLLKHENQALLEMEMKLKDANQEVKRLMNLVTELQGASGKEDFKKGTGYDKKLRKYIQASIIATSANDAQNNDAVN